MEKRYRVLRFAATLLKILAWAVLVLGVLGAFGALAVGLMGDVADLWTTLLGFDPGFSGGGGVALGIVGFAGALLATIIYFVMFYALGELLALFIAIEDNTYVMATWIRNQQPPMDAGVMTYTERLEE